MPSHFYMGNKTLASQSLPPQLPEELTQAFKGFEFKQTKQYFYEIGSGGIWQIQKGTQVLYLKIAKNLRQEANRLAWFGKMGLRVPKGEYFLEKDQHCYLVTRAIGGKPASAACQDSEIKRTVGILADALKTLHALDPSSCPFDESLENKLQLVENRVSAGKVNDFQFDDIHQGRNVTDLYGQLQKRKPPTEDAVLCHGKCSLGNLMIDAEGQVGFVGLGVAGKSDRYQDLAIVTRSFLRHAGTQFGPMWSERFLNLYGLEDVDREKIAYYRLLADFF